jgi:hypothetical protein
MRDHICFGKEKERQYKPLMIKWKDRGSYEDVKKLVMKFYKEVAKMINQDLSWIENKLKAEGIL